MHATSTEGTGSEKKWLRAWSMGEPLAPYISPPTMIAFVVFAGAALQPQKALEKAETWVRDS